MRPDLHHPLCYHHVLLRQGPGELHQVVVIPGPFLYVGEALKLEPTWEIEVQDHCDQPYQALGRSGGSGILAPVVSHLELQRGPKTCPTRSSGITPLYISEQSNTKQYKYNYQRAKTFYLTFNMYSCHVLYFCFQK